MDGQLLSTVNNRKKKLGKLTRNENRQKKKLRRERTSGHNTDVCWVRESLARLVGSAGGCLVTENLEWKKFRIVVMFLILGSF